MVGSVTILGILIGLAQPCIVNKCDENEEACGAKQVTWH